MIPIRSLEEVNSVINKHSLICGYIGAFAQSIACWACLLLPVSSILGLCSLTKIASRPKISISIVMLGLKSHGYAVKHTLQGLLSSKPGGAIAASLWPRRRPVSRRSRSITRRIVSASTSSGDSNVAGIITAILCCITN